MTNDVKCGYLDNIVYDFEQNRLPIDKVINNDDMTSGLKWKEIAKINKYYNLAIQHGNQSKYHLKLIYVIVDIICKYINNCKWCNRYVTPSKLYLGKKVVKIY